VRVTAFVGSPRAKGNTDLLIDQILRGAASVGAETEKVVLNKLNISPCQACDACHTLKKCRQDDDMTLLYPKLFESDVLVLGTPIYYWGPSAQFKAFVDRWYAIDQEGLREGLRGKRCQLVCAFGDSTPATASPTVQMMRSSVEWLDMLFEEPLLVTAGDRGEIARNAEVMARAFAIGTALGS
jgi:multimeric flavodoxin WrbA